MIKPDRLLKLPLPSPKKTPLTYRFLHEYGYQLLLAKITHDRPLPTFIVNVIKGNISMLESTFNELTKQIFTA